MSHDQLVKEKREEILRIASRYGARDVRVFGSVARGEADRESDVDFLVELMKDERFGATRTVLVTGQAGQSDTIRAVNQAGLDYYIGKPWNPEELRAVVRDQLTEYVLESDVNPLPYVSVLDGVRVMEAIR